MIRDVYRIGGWRDYLDFVGFFARRWTDGLPQLVAVGGTVLR